MIPTTAQVDTWRATVHADLERLQAGLLDLIETGVEDHPTRIVAARQDTGHAPTQRQRLNTDRADGRFEPTPKVASRRTGRSDPTGKAVAAWEARVQAEVTAVFEVLARQVENLQALGITVRDEEGGHWPPPAKPPTETTPSGKRRIVFPVFDVTLATGVLWGCRSHGLAVIRWLGAAVDALADRMYDCTDPDVGDHLDDRATELRRTLGGMARRIAPDRPRLCACGCRRPAPPVGEGATRSGCRSRLSRDRLAS